MFLFNMVSYHVEARVCAIREMDYFGSSKRRVCTLSRAVFFISVPICFTHSLVFVWHAIASMFSRLPCVAFSFRTSTDLGDNQSPGRYVTLCLQVAGDDLLEKTEVGDLCSTVANSTPREH